MTIIADAIARPSTRVPARSQATRIARVEIFRDLDQAEPVWRLLESQTATPYQRFDLLAAWQRNVGDSDQLSPLIVAAFDGDGQPLILLPLAVGSVRGVKIARFPGGKHVTFNMPLWRRDFALTAARVDLDALVAAIRARADVDALALTQQPRSWHDVANPMALLPSQTSINGCPLLKLAAGDPAALVSNSFGRRLKGKERKLQVLPGYRYTLASTDAEITRLLDAFFAVKPVRMAQQKLPNVFADPGVEDFIRAACLAKRAGGGHAIDIHALACDDEMIAIFAGVADGRRFSMMFNTYTLSDSARYSPGLILMRNIIDHYAELGYDSLDLGIGSDDYKRLFCKDDDPIFDSFIALNAKGRLAVAAMSSLGHVKHLVKHTPALMRLAQTVRGALHR
jgi:CelD/BcsL family acetyltransferase involved in cellulose biosynthesis